MASDSIVIRGAREHNLQNVDVRIPRDKLTVITGLSGSGKSSLAFDTIYAEGQRRYVESLSSYARQFLGQMDKPDLDSIDGLSPAVSIDQKTTSRNPRSTVGTVTEIYDYLRLLFARVGVPHCPECGRVIERQTTDQVADKVLAQGQGRRALVLAPVVLGRKGEYTKLFEDLRREGFSRVRIDGEVRELDGEVRLEKKLKHTVEVVVDRIVIRENSLNRIVEAIEQATKLAAGKVGVYLLPDHDDPEAMPGELLQYSLALACPIHGHSIDDLQPRDFSFNAPYGACPDCDGLGFRKGRRRRGAHRRPLALHSRGRLWVDLRPLQLLPADPLRRLRAPRRLGPDALEGPAKEGAEGTSRRTGHHQDPRGLPHARRAQHALVHHLLRRAQDPLRQVPGDDLRDYARASRALHPRGALPNVPRCPP
jgi:excinuclease UvrABC ATPase subunit